MKRVLILCPADWMAERADAAADYLHAVGSRIARDGNFVAWICASERKGLFLQETRPPIEVLDGIQVARVGPRLLYGMLVRLVLSRLKKRDKLGKLYDTIITCVDGRPLDLGANVDVPVLPVVFGLSAKVEGTADPPGSLVATSDEVHQALLAAGFPDRFIVRAPFGASIPDLDSDSSEAEDDSRAVGKQSSLVALSDSPDLVVKALELMETAVRPADVELFGRKPPRGRNTGIAWHPRADRDKHAAVYTKFTFGYCGKGYEHEALSLGGARVPAICPATSAGREFVADGETGLLCEPKDPRGLAEALTRLAKDEVLRKRLAVNARKRAEAQSWERTAALVLSVLKGL